MGVYLWDPQRQTPSSQAVTLGAPSPHMSQRHPFICASSIHSKSAREHLLHQGSVQAALCMRRTSPLLLRAQFLIFVGSSVYQATLHMYLI